jgi:hypothetical protein
MDDACSIYIDCSNGLLSLSSPPGIFRVLLLMQSTALDEKIPLDDDDTNVCICVNAWSFLAADLSCALVGGKVCLRLGRKWPLHTEIVEVDFFLYSCIFFWNASQ